MPLEERYDRLLEQYMLYQLTNYSLIKKLDATNQYYDLLVKVNKKDAIKHATCNFQGNEDTYADESFQ